MPGRSTIAGLQLSVLGVGMILIATEARAHLGYWAAIGLLLAGTVVVTKTYVNTA
ncbi:hypothetical protein [Natranaeroarchaeum aerophilus]|uniref:Uncharacterized protein n=1 Tax=Natranaeroarchaeum aerophilus TaxID=2917711 RepID=A0AAE3FT35_9EURY|nr:hypothetical protein [Natranaeroarchaeum aerophilus]MCL9814620.1 hypothetical protein [Natranaeroarchaeum aerophilus]